MLFEGIIQSKKTYKPIPKIGVILSSLSLYFIVESYILLDIYYLVSYWFLAKNTLTFIYLKDYHCYRSPQPLTFEDAELNLS